MWFLVILNALAKNISRSFAKNLFLRKQRKGEWPMTSPQRGGPGGHPPGIHTYTGTSKSPSEAVFINVTFNEAGTIRRETGRFFFSSRKIHGNEVIVSNFVPR